LTLCLSTLCLSTLCLLTSACSSGVKPTAMITVADTADQMLINMTHYVTNAGVQRARVRADTAYFLTRRRPPSSAPCT